MEGFSRRVRTVGEWVEVPFEARREHDGLRLDAFLTRRLRAYSRAAVQRLIVGGKVRVSSCVERSEAVPRSSPQPVPAAGTRGEGGGGGGASRKAARRVSEGDVVVVRYPRREEPPARHAALPVLYEDADLVAVAKPAGVLSHPTDRVVRNSVTSILRGQFPGERLHLVHRLDRETSGVLALAKHPAAARALTDQLTRRRVSKEYLALASGKVGFADKTVDLPLGREGSGIKVRQAAREGGARASAPGGDRAEASPVLEARTEFRRLAAGAAASLVLAVPRTGRLHQIRVHLAWLGHPVLGDKLYAGAGEMYLKAVRGEITAEDLAFLGAPRQMLHAWRLRLEYPVFGTPLEIVAPIPADFLDCMERFSLRADRIAPREGGRPGRNPRRSDA